MEWDDQLHCMRNGSLHSFEGDASLREGCPCSTIGPGSSILTVPPAVATDPNGRCAAVLVYGRHLALLPAMEVDYLEQLVQVRSGVASVVPSAPRNEHNHARPTGRSKQT